ncbi:hypothetical protein GYH30_039854 [Glycine max]|nr:hypothetical protein GYH30_039854 [Glycine max]
MQSKIGKKILIFFFSKPQLFKSPKEANPDSEKKHND